MVILKLRGKLAPPDRPSMVRKNGSNCLHRATVRAYRRTAKGRARTWVNRLVFLRRYASPEAPRAFPLRRVELLIPRYLPNLPCREVDAQRREGVGITPVQEPF
jgi:hypothetical protein